MDVILKKEKDTKYTKDVLRFIPIFERFKTCISEQCGIQKFNANVNLIDLYARRLEKDHGYSPESSSESFYLIRNIAYLSKLQGNLKYEANFYSKYMPCREVFIQKKTLKKRYGTSFGIRQNNFCIKTIAIIPHRPPKGDEYKLLTFFVMFK